MFKKIIDNSHCSVRSQFLQSFGIDCMSKIKNIEQKFNQVQWESEKCPFQVIVTKVRTMLDCYQLITYQIYDSFQSVQLQTLGHSIVKMFLQISSAIKWLIKSLCARYQPPTKEPQQPEQFVHRESESEKFRKRQISRFILKGVMENLQSQCCDEEIESSNTIDSYFGQNKQSFSYSKNKVLSTNSSNLPLILEDTVEYFTKKSEYIDKFVALRENYQGSNWFEQTLTSQAIIDFELNQKNSQTAEKFKEFLNKVLGLQQKNVKPATTQFGIQVTPVVSACDKIKKAAQKHKVKILSQQIEKQKATNQQLKLKLQTIQKKSEGYKFQFKQHSGLKRMVSMNTFNRRKVQQMQSKIAQGFNLPQELRTSVITQQVSKVQDLQQDSQNQQKLFYRKFAKNYRLAKNRSPKKDLQTLSAQEFMGISDSKNQESTYREPALDMFSKIVNIEIKRQQKQMEYKREQQKHNTQHILQRKLKIQSALISFEILSIENKNAQTNRQHSLDMLQFQQVSKKFIYGKMAPISPQHIASPISSPICQADQKFPAQLKVPTGNIGKENIGSFRQHKNHNWRNHKMQNLQKTRKDPLKTEILLLQSFMNKDQNENQQFNVQEKFEKQYKSYPIVTFQVGEGTLRTFFVDENNARNYQLLNLSELCNLQKKIKSMGKSLTKVHFLAPKKTNNHGCEFEGVIYNLLTKKIYSQIVKTKRVNKDIYLKLILFFRYPFSSLHRTNEIQAKLDEAEERVFCLQELQSHFKRIWAFHSRCSVVIGRTAGWCLHKDMILDLLGVKKVMSSQQYTIND